MHTDAPEELGAEDGAELVRLLNELTSRVAVRSLVNDVYLHYRVSGDGDIGWRVRVVGLGDAPPHVWLSSAGGKGGLLDALRERVTALQDEQKEERRPKQRARKPPAKPRRRVAR